MNFENKQAFLKQYVLNRARASQGSVSGDSAAEEAIKAWNVINKEVRKNNQPS